jgi:hypothetical protein
VEAKRTVFSDDHSDSGEFLSANRHRYGFATWFLRELADERCDHLA